MQLGQSCHFLNRIALAIFTITIAAHSEVPGKGQDQAPLRERLEQATERTSLDTPGTHPWHMRLSVTRSTPDGAITAQDTVEEWWAAPTMWRMISSTPAGEVTELRNNEGFFRTKDSKASDPLLRMLVRQVVHPMPPTQEVEMAQLELRTRPAGNQQLDCVTLGRPATPGSNFPFGVWPTYCFEPGQANLRTVSFSPQTGVIRAVMGHFQNRSVPMELRYEQAGQITTQAKLEELKTDTPTPDEFAQEGALERVPETINLGSTLVAGRKIKGSSPIYPGGAKASHITGSVLLSVVIGKDGKLHSIVPLYSPSPLLTGSSINAVKTWEYQPYVLNGEPTEVETTITISYNMSP